MKSRKTVFYQSMMFFGSVLILGFSMQTGHAVEDAEVSADYQLCDAWKQGEKPANQECRSNQTSRFSAGLNDTLVLKIKNFKALLGTAKCQDSMGQPSPQAQLCVPQKIFLYFDGRKVSERDPHKDGKLGMDADTIEFPLRQSQKNDDGTISENKDVWIDLLGSPKENFFLKPTQIEAGLENGYVIPGRIGFMLKRIDKFWFWTCQGIIGVFLISGLVLAAKSDILRSPGEKPVNNKKPWSLARCQMAFWLFLVITSFLFIWLVTGALDTITNGVLGLMGIGSGTALGSALIDASDDKVEKISKLKLLQEKLRGELAEIDKNLQSAPADIFLNTKRTETEDDLKMIGEQITSIKTPVATQGFFIDIVSGPSGVTLHRFQMVLWTVILGIIFIFSVWKRLSMPEFDAMLLALQGISAGTYLGFKIPEKNA